MSPSTGPRDEIPAEVRQETMAAALRGQQAFLDMFDAVEAGDLVRAAAAQIQVQQATREVTAVLRPLVVGAILSLPPEYRPGWRAER